MVEATRIVTTLKGTPIACATANITRIAKSDRIIAMSRDVPSASFRCAGPQQVEPDGERRGWGAPGGRDRGRVADLRS
jgi:hypothetical protein